MDYYELSQAIIMYLIYVLLTIVPQSNCKYYASRWGTVLKLQWKIGSVDKVCPEWIIMSYHKQFLCMISLMFC